MKEKIKVLFTSQKKPKKIKIPKKGSSSVEDMIENEYPDFYEFFNVPGEEDAVKLADKLQPEIIFIYESEPMDALGLLIKIKQLHPLAVVFIMLMEIVDDEQETIDKYMVAGAYKCLLSPTKIDTMIHDMYVCLNLE